jgi:hypothetical protein
MQALKTLTPSVTKTKTTFGRPPRAALNEWREPRGRNRQMKFKAGIPTRIRATTKSGLTRLQECLSQSALDGMTASAIDWTVDGVEPPNSIARLNAVEILAVAETLAIKPTYVTASADGGVGVCFKKDGFYADIECFNSGEIWALFSDRVKPALSWQVENNVPKISQALVTIQFKLNPDA